MMSRKNSRKRMMPPWCSTIHKIIFHTAPSLSSTFTTMIIKPSTVVYFHRNNMKLSTKDSTSIYNFEQNTISSQSYILSHQLFTLHLFLRVRWTQNLNSTKQNNRDSQKPSHSLPSRVSIYLSDTFPLHLRSCSTRDPTDRVSELNMEKMIEGEIERTKKGERCSEIQTVFHSPCCFVVLHPHAEHLHLRYCSVQNSS